MTEAAVRRALVAACVFGLCDGAMSNLGAVLGLRAHPPYVLAAALLNAVAGGMSMGVSQRMSQDNDDGLAANIALGLATAGGSVLPAGPFLWLRGDAGVIGTAVVCMLLAAVVARVHARGSLRRTAVGLGLLAGVFVVTLACALAVPTGGA